MQVIINPGSGPVSEGSRSQSKANIKAFIQDLGHPDVKFRFHSIARDGRHTYYLYHENQKVEIQMPPLPLEKVRYMQEDGQNIWHFPRLYVDGSSWVWCFALNVCFDNDED